MKQIILTGVLLCLCVGMWAQPNTRIMNMHNLFQLADERSRVLKVFELGVEVAKKDVSVAKNAFLPDVSISASAGYNSDAWVSERNFSNAQTFSSPHFANSFGVEASMIVFAGGAIRNTIKSKEVKASIAKWSMEECRQQVYFLLAGYYLDYCKNINLLQVLDKNISQARMMINEMTAKAEAGVVLENDITRYEVQLQNLLYSRKETESIARIYHNRITTMLDLPIDTSIEPDSALITQSMPQFTLMDAQSLANSYSPALNRDSLEIQSIDHNMHIAKANYYPNVRFYAGDNLKGPITYEIPTLNNNINVWYFGVGLSYNIGSLYKVSRELSKLSTSRKQADMQLQARRQEVLLNVHDSYIHYLDAFELLHTQETTLRLAEENYKMISNRYANGLALVTDLVDADNLRLSAEIQYINARINIIYNYYKLLYSAGYINPNNNELQ